MALRALLYRRPSEPSSIQVVFERSIYLVRLRRHRQARRYTLRIDAASREVVLTMPPRGHVKEARDFAQKHGGWIAARLKRLPEAAPFAHGIEVPLRGEPHRIVHRRGARGTVWMRDRRIRQPASLRRRRTAARRPPHQRLPAARGGARARSAARRYAKELGVTIKRISVRDQSSRWGSCSNTGVLSFSWRLILAPPLRARLPRRARGRASRRAQSFGTVLAAGRANLPGFRARQGLARCARHRSASLRPARQLGRKRPVAIER